MKRKNNDITNIQRKIGYDFKNTDLMFQAFVRKSYSEENGGENNEVLEFIGDKVLDLIVVKLLAEKYGKIQPAQIGSYDDLEVFVSEFNEGELTEKKRKLVEKKNLAERMRDLGFSKYLIMSKGDLKNELQYSKSVMEDLFEAIIGAIALDSNWNLKEIQNVVECMLDLENFSDDDENYMNKLQEWSLKKYGVLPDVQLGKLDRYESPNQFCHMSNEIIAPWRNYETIRIADIKKCVIILEEINYKFIGYGYSNSEARSAASKVAYEFLEKNDLELSIRDEIDEPNADDAISQLEILARRGYFSIPTYKFKQTYDKDGNPIWNCVCNINEIEKSFSKKSSSKKDAKKNSAYKMLNYVLEAL